MRNQKVFLLIITVSIGFCIQAQPSLYEDLDGMDKVLYDEHIYMGQPDADSIYVRQGFILNYAPNWRIPEWCAYHIIPDYLCTPKREKKYKSFRQDTDVPNGVVTDDYTGSGYARGHMVPYFAMGGDRGGVEGEISDLMDEALDPYDDKTVFQANYMSNIAPQDHSALNGAGGPWYALETKIRKVLVPNLKELYLVVGGIISDPDDYEVIENEKGDIAIPDKYYQVIIYRLESGDHITAAFLFPHVREKEDLPSRDVLDYLVPVDDVEELTGLDFFPDLSDAEENRIESEKNDDFWKQAFALKSYQKPCTR